MASKPSKQEKLQAFVALWDAVTPAEKKKVLKKHRNVLLRKYGFFEEAPTMVGAEWIKELGGFDGLGQARYTADICLIDEARKHGIDKALTSYEHSLDALISTLAPKGRKKDMSNQVLANVTYLEYDVDPHPVLNHKQSVQLVAFPEMLVVRRRSDGKDLLEIPWHNIVRLHPITQSRSTALKLGVIPFTDVIWPNLVKMNHDGVMLQYDDAIFDGKLTLFFRVRGRKNAQKLTKTINARVYDYKWRMGQVGNPR